MDPKRRAFILKHPRLVKFFTSIPLYVLIGVPILFLIVLEIILFIIVLTSAFAVGLCCPIVGIILMIVFFIFMIKLIIDFVKSTREFRNDYRELKDGVENIERLKWIQSRVDELEEIRFDDKKGCEVSKKAASRIQSHADKSGRNQGFKSRAQKAASNKKN